MKRIMIIILLAMLCLGLGACSLEEMNTHTGAEGLVTLYETSDQDSYFTYIKKIDSAKYEILDITISPDERYAITTRVKNKWKETENTEAFKVSIYERYYIFSTGRVEEYLNFLECLDSERYEILDISALPSHNAFYIVYEER